MKTYTILVSLIVIGLALSIISLKIPSEHWVSGWLMQLAAVCMIGGGLGVIDKTLLRKDHFNQTRDLFMIHESATELGLTKIESDANTYSYTRMIRESPNLIFVLNDGRTWICGRVVDFQHRFTQRGFMTELFVTDPQGEFVKLLGAKTGYSESEQQSKIEQAKKRMIGEFEAKGKVGLLKIYHVPFFITHSVFLASNEAVISLYGISSGRRSVPLFSCHRISRYPSLFADIEDDINKLRDESTCVYDSNNLRTEQIKIKSV